MQKPPMQFFRITFTGSIYRKVFYKSMCSAKSSSVVYQNCSCRQNSVKMPEKEFIFNKIADLQPANKNELRCMYFSRVFDNNSRRAILQNISWRLLLHSKTASLSKGNF